MGSRGPRRSPRKHTQSKKAPKSVPKKAAAKKGKKNAEPPLPKINWKADEAALIWALIGRMEVKENRLVLFGKDSSDENTVGDSKMVVYKRMGGDIMPQLFAMIRVVNFARIYLAFVVTCGTNTHISCMALRALLDYQ
ncbi:hypothetical protein R3P38DRAFT_2939819 [Favolaschia claudopus]|uniref:Uncharacterized protein n=1 Tax=Favolaschia claudopus TaxID=2862362 RepID=A0AAW0BNP4_9AGAR